MRKTFDSVKEMCDNDISLAFMLMCEAKNDSNNATVLVWYKDLLSIADFANRIGLLSVEDRMKLKQAIDAVFEQFRGSEPT